MMAPAIVSAQSSTLNQLKPDTRAADSLYFAAQWKLAIPVYELILEKNPGNSLCLNRLGFSYQNTSQFQKALNSYSNSLLYQPAPQLKMVVQSRMARVYALLGDRARAFMWLDSAVHNGYGNLRELDSLDDYSSLRQQSQFKNLYADAYKIAYPCMSDQNSRQFDFWVGDWNVFQNGNANTIVGKSKVEIASGGCMILENWTSLVGSHNGKSMNYYDPLKGNWEQLWIGSEGGPQVVHHFINGHYKDGTMRFEFSGSDARGNS